MAALVAPFTTHAPNKFDVFLSFRTEDTRDRFASHLYGALFLKYANGLPLAILILGSHQFDIPKVSYYWPNPEQIRSIQEESFRLNYQLSRVSFDGLEGNMKSIFLDIAFFFQGDDKDVVKRVLDGCGFSADRGINYLIDRSLVIMKDSNKLHINSLFRGMAESTVWQQSLSEPGWRSRLWDAQEIYHIFRRNTVYKYKEKISQIEKYLVELKMQYSQVEQLWKGNQSLDNLKAIDLSFSNKLTEVPNLSQAPNIESVTLSYCEFLREIPLYCGSLAKLTSLNLKGCSSLDNVLALPENIVNVNLKRCVSLKSLPSSIYTLKSLRRLEIAGCSKFEYSKNFLEFLDGLKYNLENSN